MDQKGLFQKKEEKETDAKREPKEKPLSPSEEKMSKLLQMIGNPSECKGCHKLIIWITTKLGKAMPLDPDGAPHWGSCPNARDFKKKKGE